MIDFLLILIDIMSQSQLTIMIILVNMFVSLAASLTHTNISICFVPLDFMTNVDHESVIYC
jgi:hypothetical protein